MPSPIEAEPLPPFFWPSADGCPPDIPRPASAFGHDEGSWLVVTAGGAVESRWADGGARFVNSTADAFSESLEAFRPIWLRRADASEAAASEDLELVQARLESIDPASLAERDAWWALVVEQMGNELL